MSKILLGAIAGTVLGLLDGFSAFFIPEAADMMTEIKGAELEDTILQILRETINDQ